MVAVVVQEEHIQAVPDLQIAAAAVVAVFQVIIHLLPQVVQA